jgi:molybdopterin converting factor small subunit
VNVLIPSNLADYTGHEHCVTASGATLAEALADLDRRYPGIRFRIVSEQDRIRRHVNIFVNREPAKGLDAPLAARDEIMIVCALSGG